MELLYMIVGSVLLLLLLFMAWKRIILSTKVQQAEGWARALVEPYLNLAPLFFTIYQKHIPSNYRYLRHKATLLTILLCRTEVYAYIDLLHFLDDMEELLDTMNRKKLLKDNPQFQLVDQDFRNKHQQLRDAINVLELHDYFRYVNVLHRGQ